MAANLKEIEDRIAQLSSEERARLIHRLVRSLDTAEDVDAEAAN